MIKKVLRFLMIIQLFTLNPLYSQDTHIEIKSEYLNDSLGFRIVNTEIEKDTIIKLIFVLPVEKTKNFKYGSGIDECKKLIDRNIISNNIVFVQPDYDIIPWYGSHPTDEDNNQLKYTIELIKLIRLKYNHNLTKIYLLGFSKSGFGAMNLIIKHPELIDGIMIWDAPLSTEWNEKWGMQYSFGTKENFMNNYYLMRDNIELEVLKNKLIIIGGFDLFENQTKEFQSRLDKYGINYICDNNIRFKHEWNKDWIYKLLQHSGFIIKK
jgi:hypothetical protein